VQQLAVGGTIRARGLGATILFDSGAAILLDGARVSVGSGAGSRGDTASVLSANSVTSPGGTIRIDASDADVAGRLTAQAGGAGGDVRIKTRSGDLHVAGSVDVSGARGSAEGIIEAAAAGDLTAAARFASGGGCIALSAGGTLDTAGSSFDTPPVIDCPGSPSGAFLD
jgi:hypothetical protein